LHRPSITENKKADNCQQPCKRSSACDTSIHTLEKEHEFLKKITEKNVNEKIDDKPAPNNIKTCS